MANSITFSAAPGKTIPEDVRRCLAMLYATREGEQALDRAFGISWDAVDAPPYVARALLTQEIIAKTRRYEPRAQFCASIMTSRTFPARLRRASRWR